MNTITVTLKKWSKNDEQRVYLNLDNDDFGYLVIDGDDVDFDKVEAEHKDRIIASVEKRTAKLKAQDEDYTAADAVNGAASLTF